MSATIIHTPEEKVGNALALLFKDLSVPIYGAWPDEDMQEPCLCVYPEDAEPMHLNVAGNWTVRMLCEIRTNRGDTTTAEHWRLLGELRDILIDSEIIANLNAVAVEMTVLQMTIEKCSHETADNSRISRQAVTVDMLPNAITGD